MWYRCPTLLRSNSAYKEAAGTAVSKKNGHLREIYGSCVRIEPQPDGTSCGPTCLHAIYDFYGEELVLDEVIAEVKTLQGGGTLAVFLANHALERGYRATIYTYNLQLFDPTWFSKKGVNIKRKLAVQRKAKRWRKLREASDAYQRFLELGGKIRMEDLTPALLREHLERRAPILTGLSATYLYQEPREISSTGRSNDVRGTPTGHFVVLCGYDPMSNTVLVADPYLHGSQEYRQYYEVSMARVVNSILLGIVTYDANLLIIERKKKAR